VLFYDGKKQVTAFRAFALLAAEQALGASEPAARPRRLAA